jgi:hypothetical protein
MITPIVSFKDTAAASPYRCPPLPVQDSGLGRVRRESLDAPEDLPKQAPRQLAFGKLEREGPRVPNQAPAECEEGLAIRPSQPVGSSPLDPSTRGRRVETILVVDDEDGVRSLVRDILEPRGCTILDTGDPRQALRIAREHPTPIDLFLIDVLMPLNEGH